MATNYKVVESGFQKDFESELNKAATEGWILDKFSTSQPPNKGNTSAKVRFAAVLKKEV